MLLSSSGLIQSKEITVFGNFTSSLLQLLYEDKPDAYHDDFSHKNQSMKMWYSTSADNKAFHWPSQFCPEKSNRSSRWRLSLSTHPGSKSCNQQLDLWFTYKAVFFPFSIFAGLYEGLLDVVAVELYVVLL